MNNSITNHYTLLDSKHKKKSHNPKYKQHLLDLPMRCLIISPSGGGKTNLVIELLRRTSGSFSDVIICARNAEQPLFKQLKDKHKEVKLIEVNENGDNIPKMIESDDQKLIIFDDCYAIKNQSNILDYFIRSRHFNYSCLYLTQSYFSSNKDFKKIRLQCNYLFILKVNSMRDLNLILTDFPINLSKEQFKKAYEYCTREKMNFMLVDCDNAKIRKNFLEILN